MNERQTMRTERIEDVPSYLARYAAEVDAWARDARNGRR